MNNNLKFEKEKTKISIDDLDNIQDLNEIKKVIKDVKKKKQ